MAAFVGQVLRRLMVLDGAIDAVGGALEERLAAFFAVILHQLADGLVEQGERDAVFAADIPGLEDRLEALAELEGLIHQHHHPLCICAVGFHNAVEEGGHDDLADGRGGEQAFQRHIDKNIGIASHHIVEGKAVAGDHLAELGDIEKGGRGLGLADNAGELVRRQIMESGGERPGEGAVGGDGDGLQEFAQVFAALGDGPPKLRQGFLFRRQIVVKQQIGEDRPDEAFGGLSKILARTAEMAGGPDDPAGDDAEIFLHIVGGLQDPFEGVEIIGGGIFGIKGDHPVAFALTRGMHQWPDLQRRIEADQRPVPFERCGHRKACGLEAAGADKDQPVAGSLPGGGAQQRRPAALAPGMFPGRIEGDILQIFVLVRPVGFAEADAALPELPSGVPQAHECCISEFAVAASLRLTGIRRRQGQEKKKQACGERCEKDLGKQYPIEAGEGGAVNQGTPVPVEGADLAQMIIGGDKDHGDSDPPEQLAGFMGDKAKAPVIDLYDEGEQAGGGIMGREPQGLAEAVGKMGMEKGRVNPFTQQQGQGR